MHFIKLGVGRYVNVELIREFSILYDSQEEEKVFVSFTLENFNIVDSDSFDSFEEAQEWLDSELKDYLKTY